MSLPQRRTPASFADLEKTRLALAVAEEAAKHPDKVVEVFATDERRLGLKPVARRVWAPVGARPVALGRHRFGWLYVTAFVSPATGGTVRCLSDGVSEPFFEGLLAASAKRVGAGRERIVVLALDNAGRHAEPGLAVPGGLRLVHLPPYPPEPQPAECPWPVLDEPLVNRHCGSIGEVEDIVARRCVGLHADRQLVGGRTAFHWWPKLQNPS